MLKNNNKNYDIKQIMFLQLILAVFSLSSVFSKIASSYTLCLLDLLLIMVYHCL